MKKVDLWESGLYCNALSHRPKILSDISDDFDVAMWSFEYNPITEAIRKIYDEED